MKRARRVISHHGSDCPDGPHPFRWNRCVILTRIDRPGQQSEAWASGDRSESNVFRKHRHTFDASKPVHYGGGFWQRVEIKPAGKE